MRTKLRKISYWFSVIIVGAILGLSLQLVKAWTEPSSTPPSVNVGAPINTGSAGQVKNGALGVVGSLQAFYNTFLATDGGNVGIGTTTPGYKLHVVGDAYIAPSSAGRYLFTANSTSGYTTTFNMNDTGLYMGHNSASRSLNLRTNNQDRLTILGNGNIGVGKSPASDKLLDVAGKINGTELCINNSCKNSWPGSSLSCTTVTASGSTNATATCSSGTVVGGACSFSYDHLDVDAYAQTYWYNNGTFSGNGYKCEGGTPYEVNTYTHITATQAQARCCSL